MTDNAAVRAVGLEKTFGGRPAVFGVDLTLHDGECLALFGPNGAGKTTLLRLLAGLLKPTSGAVRVRDVDVRRDPAARAGVGLVSHHSMLYAPLTAMENVEFAARLHGMPAPTSAARDALATLGVAELAGVRVARMSRGQQQRVSIARAVVHGPTLLLLDEPYSGLDESGAAALTLLLRSVHTRGATLVVVTHNIAEGLALATHAAIMSAGSFAKFERRPTPGFDVARFATEYRALVGVEYAG
jgi:heme exporter protein A